MPESEFRDQRFIETEKKHYLDRLDETDTGAYANGFGHPLHQRMRFDMIREFVLPKEENGSYSLLDVGCGTGDILVYLSQEHRMAPNRYLGLDILPEMVERAKKTVPERIENWGMGWPSPAHADFKVGTMYEHWATPDPDGEEPYMYDYAISLSAFSFKDPKESMQDGLIKVQETINQMYQVCNKGVAVSLFSSWKTEIMPIDMVIDPAVIFSWAKTRYERVDLLHGYAPFDFLLVIRKEPSEWRQEWDRVHGNSILRGAAA